MHPSRINVFGDHFKSVEHAWHWKIATELGKKDLAQEIKDTEHAGAARIKSKELNIELKETMEHRRIDIMKRLIHLKAKQNKDFESALMDTKEYIGEATPHRFWGTGLNPELTVKTKPQYWPGQNNLGIIMMEVREELLSFTSQSTQSRDSTEELIPLLQPASNKLEDGELGDNFVMPDETTTATTTVAVYDRDDSETTAAATAEVNDRDRRGRTRHRSEARRSQSLSMGPRAKKVGSDKSKYQKEQDPKSILRYLSQRRSESRKRKQPETPDVSPQASQKIPKNRISGVKDQVPGTSDIKDNQVP
jgi:ribA/ribD-fused uncharacterized protein